MIAEFIFYGLAAYLLVGTFFALWFVTVGIGKFDAASRGAGIFFRVLIFFGATALWAVLAVQMTRRRYDGTNP